MFTIYVNISTVTTKVELIGCFSHPFYSFDLAPLSFFIVNRKFISIIISLKISEILLLIANIKNEVNFLFTVTIYRISQSLPNFSLVRFHKSYTMFLLSCFINFFVNPSFVVLRSELLSILVSWWNFYLEILYLILFFYLFIYLSQEFHYQYMYLGFSFLVWVNVSIPYSNVEFPGFFCPI